MYTILYTTIVLALCEASSSSRLLRRHRLLETSEQQEQQEQGSLYQPEQSDESPESTTLPSIAIPDTAELSVKAGNAHTCVMYRGYGIKCWGNGFQGALGYGDRDSRGDVPDSMGSSLPFVDLGADFFPDSISVANGVTCVLGTNHNVKCFGSGSHAQTGTETSDFTMAPRQLSFGDSMNGKVSQLYAGGFSGAVVDQDSRHIKLWGSNFRGQLGYGEDEDSTNEAHFVGDAEGEMGNNLPSLDLGSDLEIVQVALGELHSCAVLKKLKKAVSSNPKTTLLKCWGYGARGQLGYGDSDSRSGAEQMGDNLKAVKLGSDFNPVFVTVGDGFTCVLGDTGSVKCFGDNLNGQLGRGDKVAFVGTKEEEMGRNLPTVNLGSKFVATAVQAGRDHVCALSTSAKIKCWGGSYYGQLGIGSMHSKGLLSTDMGKHLKEVQLGDDFVPTQLSVGFTHSCALSKRKQLKCWGSNAYGELGLEDRVSRGSTSEQMGNALPIVQVFSQRLEEHFNL